MRTRESARVGRVRRTQGWRRVRKPRRRSGRVLTSQSCAIDNGECVLVISQFPCVNQSQHPETDLEPMRNPHFRVNDDRPLSVFVFSSPRDVLETLLRPAMACDCGDASTAPSTRREEDIEDLGEARGASFRERVLFSPADARTHPKRRR